MAQALRVDLPRAAAPADVEPAPLTVVARLDGTVTVDGQPVALDALASVLAARVAARPDVVLRLGADAAVPYQRIAELLAAGRQAGLRRIAFATREP